MKLTETETSTIDKNSLWGIDLGGTKIEGAILKSSADPRSLFRNRVPTEADQGYEHILSQAKKMVDLMQAEAGFKPERIGFSTPGVLDPKLGTMKNCNTVAMNGKPMKADLEKILGIKIEMANDADCFALAEARYGIVKERFPDARIVFGVILGTGVGGGIVVDGRAIIGLQGIAGEWGHNFLDESGGLAIVVKPAVWRTSSPDPRWRSTISRKLGTENR
jgi:fructokinase